jgi:hypothetical protein
MIAILKQGSGIATLWWGQVGAREVTIHDRDPETGIWNRDSLVGPGEELLFV